MTHLHVSKRTMMRLIRDCKDQIGVPIPQPNCKDVKFTTEDGDYKVFWRSDGTGYSFTLTSGLNLWAHIHSTTTQFYLHKIVHLDRDWLTGLGILVEGEEGLVCQG